MVSDIKKKRKGNKVLAAAGGFFIMVLLILITIANVKIYRERAKVVSQIESLQNRIQELKSKNNNLQQTIAKTDDQSYIEKVAREQLDLQQSGEKVVSFIASQEQKQENKQASSGGTNIWLGWLTSSWQWLKNQLGK